MADKKYYWLRLHKDFFKRHEIRIIEAMPNGKDYVLFYLKLLVESVSHEGNLRFSDTVPYSMEMLSVLTNTNVDVVKSAIEVFTELNMIEILDDATIFMSEVNTMIGSASEIDPIALEHHRERQKRYRERQKQKQLETSRDANVTVTRDGEIRDKSIENRNNNTLVSSDVDTEQKLIDDFNIIYDHYPKKGTKASAFESYKKWVQKSGRKVSGKTYHLTNKQIWAAVDNYVREQQSKNTELSYYKNFVTLMNQLLDWVVEDGEEAN